MKKPTTNEMLIFLFAATVMLLFFVSVPVANMELLKIMVGALIGYVVGKQGEKE